MLAKVKSFCLKGLDGVPIEVETDINNGLPAYELVGLPDTAVKESRERVRSAIKNTAKKFPVTKIVVNLAPADVKKEGSSFDLPIALSILKATDQLANVDIDNVVILGELALDGKVRGVSGILPILISAKDSGYKDFIIPAENANEASYIDGLNIIAVSSLKEAVNHLLGIEVLTPLATRSYTCGKTENKFSVDMSFVKGQATAKRALEIAVSGGHNILMVGPPGTGKTMLARCIPTIMPDMSFDEALEVTKIHSVAGMLNEEGIITERPFRKPHHTATTISLCGGGNKVIRPGEISLAHNGVLFMDELPEYNRSTLEALRQPLEDGIISISRAGASVTFPANFMLCASMNPCPCGNYGSDKLVCTCTNTKINQYRSKISGPLLDRIDIQVEVDSVNYDDLVSNREEETSAEIKTRVDRTRKIQQYRYKKAEIFSNSNMGEKEIKKYCALSKECEQILKQTFESLNLSARARSRILKVARTIADMELSEDIKVVHLLEAISYRTFDKMV